MHSAPFRRAVLVTLGLLAAAGCGSDALDPDDSSDQMAQEALLVPGLRPLDGERNKALRTASEDYDVLLETLAVIAYMKGRFEAADPPSLLAPEPPAEGVDEDMAAPLSVAGVDAMPDDTDDESI